MSITIRNNTLFPQDYKGISQKTAAKVGRSIGRAIPDLTNLFTVPINTNPMKINYPPKFMDQVNAIIERNLSNETFSGNDLCNSLALSPSQVYRKIRRYTGMSTSLYIRNFRLAVAKQIIEASELQISEVTYMVGFNCLSYFSRSFSQVYGFPPSSLRVPRA